MCRATSDQLLRELAEIYGKIINAGYVLPKDCLHVIETKNGSRFIPLDLDCLVSQEMTKPSEEKRREAIIRQLSISKEHVPQKRFLKFIEFLLEVLENNELKKTIKEKFYIKK